jgi:thiosulfate reductase cytochrome b subunit
MTQPDASVSPAGQLYYRHALPIRLMHWINVLAFTLLLMSGLQIFNAHPALNWGKSSYTDTPALLEMEAQKNAQGEIVGITRLFGHEFNTTGVLGASADADGNMRQRGFPAWITVPGTQWLALARRWHFFFAWLLVINGVAYLLYSLISRHWARDLLPNRHDWRSFGQSIKDHLRLRHPRGEAATRYNILQKLAYLHSSLWRGWRCRRVWMRCGRAGSTSWVADSRRARCILSPRGCWSPSCSFMSSKSSSAACGTICVP